MGSGGEFADCFQVQTYFKLITQTQKHKTNPPFLIHVVSSCLSNLHLF